MPVKKPKLQKIVEQQTGELISFNEIMAWLEIPKRSLRRYTTQDTFPKHVAHRGRAALWKKADVEAWIFSQRGTPADPDQVATLRDLYNRLIEAKGRAAFTAGSLSVSRVGKVSLLLGVPGVAVEFKAPGWKPIDKDGEPVPLPGKGVTAELVFK